MDTNQFNRAIELLKRSKDEILPLLESSPDIHHNFSIAFLRLINGLSVVTGRPVEDIDYEASPALQEEQPLTHIAGIPIQNSDNFRRSPKEAIPTRDELTDYQYEVQQVLNDVPLMDTEEILGRYSDNAIRGAAVKAGLDTMAAMDGKIKTLVVQIREKLETAVSDDEKIRRAEEETERIKNSSRTSIQDTPTTEVPEMNPEFTPEVRTPQEGSLEDLMREQEKNVADDQSKQTPAATHPTQEEITAPKKPETKPKAKR